MGKAVLGLAMVLVLLRSYIGLSPWKLALLLLGLFVLNLLQVSLRLGRGAGRGSRRTVLPRSFDSAHAIASPCSSVSTYRQCSPNPNVRQSAPSESEAFSPVFRGDDAAGLKWGAKLTRTPRGLRRVRTGYAYQPPRTVRTRGAGRLAPRARRTVPWVCVPAFGVPHAITTYRVDHPRWGVASVQGRRQHMEDMYQAEGFGGAAAPGAHSAGRDADAARLGLTHFFAVFDGHGGKRAAAWAREHLLANLLPRGQDVPAVQDAAGALEEAVREAFLQTDRAFLTLTLSLTLTR